MRKSFFSQITIKFNVSRAVHFYTLRKHEFFRTCPSLSYWVRKIRPQIFYEPREYKLHGTYMCALYVIVVVTCCFPYIISYNCDILLRGSTTHNFFSPEILSHRKSEDFSSGRPWESRALSYFFTSILRVEYKIIASSYSYRDSHHPLLNWPSSHLHSRGWPLRLNVPRERLFSESTSADSSEKYIGEQSTPRSPDLSESKYRYASLPLWILVKLRLLQHEYFREQGCLNETG